MKKIVTLLIAILISLFVTQGAFAKAEIQVGLGAGLMGLKSGFINNLVREPIQIGGVDSDTFITPEDVKAAMLARSYNFSISGYVDINDIFSIAGDISVFKPGFNEHRTSVLNILTVEFGDFSNIGANYPYIHTDGTLAVKLDVEKIDQLSVFTFFESMVDASLYGRFKIVDDGKTKVSLQAGASYSGYNFMLSGLDGLITVGKGIKLESYFIGLGLHVSTQTTSKLSFYGDVKIPVAELFSLTVPIPTDLLAAIGASQEMTEALSVRPDMRFVGALMIDLKAGLKYAVAPNVNVGLEVRVTNMNSVRVAEFVLKTIAPPDVKDDLKMWTPTISLTLGYSF